MDKVLDGLTPLELNVLLACWNAADNNGGDFACLDEVHLPKLGRKALGGVVTSLENKRKISVDVTYVNGSYRSKGDRVVQITFDDDMRAALTALANPKL